MYDNLIDESLLSFASKAQLIYVGKRPGRHAKTQEEINELLLKYTREGKVVVRLKGGDPFVLGRGDEECEYLVSNGVECEVIPAPTSAVAAPACVGIPITRRRLANSFAVVTGRAAEGSEVPKYGEIMKVVKTLVVLMGIGNLREIVNDIESSVGPVPGAVIYKGCTREQKVVLGTSTRLPELVERNGITSPSVIVFGEVVRWAWERGLVRSVAEARF